MTFPPSLDTAVHGALVGKSPSPRLVLGGVSVVCGALPGVALAGWHVPFAGRLTWQNVVPDADVVHGAVEEGLVASGHLTLLLLGGYDSPDGWQNPASGEDAVVAICRPGHRAGTN